MQGLLEWIQSPPAMVLEGLTPQSESDLQKAEFSLGHISLIHCAQGKQSDGSCFSVGHGGRELGRRGVVGHPFSTPALFINNLGRNPDFTGTLCPWEMCLPTLQKGFRGLACQSKSRLTHPRLGCGFGLPPAPAWILIIWRNCSESPC